MPQRHDPPSDEAGNPREAAAARLSEKHDNKVTLVCSAIASIQFIPNSFTITKDQPFDLPPSISQSGDTWTIVARCGRKNSEPVASTYHDLCGDAAHMLTSMGGDQAPKELNFCFGIRLQIRAGNTLVPVDLYLGQGHSVRNNWWIGGPGLAYSSDPIVPIVDATDSLLDVLKVSTSDVDHFSMDSQLNAPSNVNQAKWLEQLEDDISVDALNLPGTHDSAAIAWFVAGTYSCHYDNLTEQMEKGVRLFDIRIKVKKSDGGYTFVTCHGNIGLGIDFNEYQSLQSAFEEFRDFLATNTGEFLAMSLKVDDWDGNEGEKPQALDALAAFLKPFDTILTTSPHIPKLGDVRGKIWLFNRIAADARFGPFIDIPDNTPGQTLPPASPLRNFSVAVQDRYEKLGDTPVTEKLSLFKAMIAATQPGTLTLNFASGRTGVANLRILMANGAILKDLGASKAGGRATRLGWSLLDFEEILYPSDTYGPISIVDLIIDSNVGYSRYPQAFKLLNVKDEL